MVIDEELYRQYLRGDEAGLEALMRKYGNPLTLYINGYLHDVHEAEDLMIEVFSYLFTKKPRIRDGGLKAYLYKAARHMALRHKSRHRLFFSLDDLTEEPDGKTLVEEVIRTKERDQILHICMDELKADYREALYLTYFEGMSYQQAAEIMGKSDAQRPAGRHGTAGRYLSRGGGCLQSAPGFPAGRCHPRYQRLRLRT